MTSRWLQYLLVGVVLAGGNLLMPNGLTRYVAYLAIGATAVVAMIVGVRSNRPTDRRPWYLTAAGIAVWLVGDSLYNWFTDAIPVPSSPPVWAYAPYPLAYVLLVTGLLLVVRGRHLGRQPIALLDTLIVTVALGVASWVFLVIPGWGVAGVPLVSRLIGVGYPLCDVLLVATGIRLVTGPGFWNTSSRLLVCSVVTLLLTNGLMQRTQFAPALEAYGQLLDGGWLLAFMLWGAAALHPSMRELSEPAPEREDAMLVGRLVVIAAAVMIVPAVVLSEVFAGAPLHPYPIVIGSTILVVLFTIRTIRIVTQLKGQAALLSALAGTDFVTGLANRRGFSDCLDEHFAGAGADAGSGSAGGGVVAAVVVLVDVERFTELTDTLGHDTGDALLAAVGQRLIAFVGADALVANFGGETFAILSRAVDRAGGFRSLELRSELERPYPLPDLSVSLEVSVGVVGIPEDAATPALALHCAGVALVRAKALPGRIARYDADMETGGTFAAVLVGELRGALERSEIVVYYQPQVEIRTGRVFGVEALARWQHPTHGFLPPDSFIPGAEQTGVIGPFTAYVLDRAVKQCAAWRRDGLELTVAVNLSVRNLLDPELITDVRHTLARHGLPASSLELEITEGIAMVDPNRCLQMLGELAGLGIKLSVDDYGTGHSSLAYLQRLPVRRLKVDRSFVTDLTRDRDCATIVRSTIELARHLGLDVVAEGVEDDATLLALRDMQCFSAQGFGLGRPVAGSLLPALVRAIESRMPDVVRGGGAETRWHGSGARTGVGVGVGVGVQTGGPDVSLAPESAGPRASVHGSVTSWSR